MCSVLGRPWVCGAPATHVSCSASARGPALIRGALLPVRFVSSALRRDVDSLTQEQAEARKQSEKDRAALLSQMAVLEAELEEQLARQEASAQQAEELRALRQQLAALDKQLRSQRQFMDVSILDLDALDGRPWRSPPPRALPGHDVRARAQPRCCGPFASLCMSRGLSPRARAGCGGPSAAHLADPACPALPGWARAICRPWLSFSLSPSFWFYLSEEERGQTHKRGGGEAGPRGAGSPMRGSIPGPETLPRAEGRWLGHVAPGDLPSTSRRPGPVPASSLRSLTEPRAGSPQPGPWTLWEGEGRARCGRPPARASERAVFSPDPTPSPFRPGEKCCVPSGRLSSPGRCLPPQEQAVEREHEREEFQREIERLEEQLRQAARPRPRGSYVCDVSQPPHTVPVRPPSRERFKDLTFWMTFFFFPCV